ncbi:hypothetical protein LTV02_11905 [Nocardia yamanashiensis]|uniref:hypothetical protein n=1 Tax=Nocardia yamanashiensis TaxID=209247 RepID=UPI001E63E66D|nr:hypothetical protein [Nocardia yamanashiensis]UGT44036.1 hypothetical protein LTV02_11905 [Nocardia yamanashiensis]
MDLGNNAATPGDRAYEPFPHGAGGDPPAHPTQMPGSVRAARIISWLYGLLGIALPVVAGVTGNYELCGALVGVFLPAYFLAILAFGYTVNGNGLRVASIIFASLGLLLVLSRVGGLLNLAPNLAIIILLARSEAGAWFKRPH